MKLTTQELQDLKNEIKAETANLKKGSDAIITFKNNKHRVTLTTHNELWAECLKNGSNPEGYKLTEQDLKKPSKKEIINEFADFIITCCHFE